jgi:hypothetical protein
MTKKHGWSEVWHFFEVFQDVKYKAWAFCTLCCTDINYTDTMNMGMLVRHLQKQHKDEYYKVIIE